MHARRFPAYPNVLSLRGRRGAIGGVFVSIIAPRHIQRILGISSERVALLHTVMSDSAARYRILDLRTQALSTRILCSHAVRGTGVGHGRMEAASATFAFARCGRSANSHRHRIFLGQRFGRATNATSSVQCLLCCEPVTPLLRSLDL